MADFFVFTFAQCLGETPSEVFWHKTVDKRIETTETELFVWTFSQILVGPRPRSRYVPVDVSQETTGGFDMFHWPEHLEPDNIEGLQDLEKCFLSEISEKIKSYFKCEDWGPAEDENCHHHHQHRNNGLHLGLCPVLPTNNIISSNDVSIWSFSKIPSSDAGLVVSSGEGPGQTTGVIHSRLKCLWFSFLFAMLESVLKYWLLVQN